MKHLTYYVIIFNSDVETFDNQVEYLQYGTFEEMLNFLDEAKKEYPACGYHASIHIIQNGKEIDKELVDL